MPAMLGGDVRGDAGMEDWVDIFSPVVVPSAIKPLIKIIQYLRGITSALDLFRARFEAFNGANFAVN